MSNINCSDAAITILRKAVVLKYGQLYGVLKQEVDVALQEHAKKLQKEGTNGST